MEVDALRVRSRSSHNLIEGVKCGEKMEPRCETLIYGNDRTDGLEFLHDQVYNPRAQRGCT